MLRVDNAWLFKRLVILFTEYLCSRTYELPEIMLRRQQWCVCTVQEPQEYWVLGNTLAVVAWLFYGLGIDVLNAPVVACWESCCLLGELLFVGRVVVCRFFKNMKYFDTLKAYFFFFLCMKLPYYYQLCLYDTGIWVSVKKILHFVCFTKCCHMLAICNLKISLCLSDIASSTFMTV